MAAASLGEPSKKRQRYLALAMACRDKGVCGRRYCPEICKCARRSVSAYGSRKFGRTIEKTTAVLGARNGMPRQRRVRSTILPGNLQVRKALTERRYISVCGRRSARKPATAKGEALGEPSKKPDGLMARPVHKSDHSTILRGCLQYIAKSYHNPSARG